jgi:integrase
MLHRNPADAVNPPKVERAVMQTYDLDQTATLIDAMRGTRLLVPTMLAVLCGLRRGEVVALKWRNVDLAASRLAVVESAEQVGTNIRYKSPKSGNGRQLVMSARLVDELRTHRMRQAEELLRVGVRLTDDTFVVAQVDGSPIQPDTLTQDWTRKIEKTGLPVYRFHDLRHAHAQHILANGRTTVPEAAPGRGTPRQPRWHFFRRWGPQAEQQPAA